MGRRPQAGHFPIHRSHNTWRRGTCIVSNPARSARDAVLFTFTPNPLLMRFEPLPGV